MDFWGHRIHTLRNTDIKENVLINKNTHKA